MAKKARSTSEILDRLPPHNLDVEQEVLGCIILSSDMLDDVAPIIKAEDFYADAHVKLYRHLLAMRDGGQRIDTTLLVERLKQAGELEAVGGRAYIAEVAHSVAHAAHAVQYAEIVRDKATLRSLIHTTTEILRDAYRAGDPAEEILNRAQARIAELGAEADAGSPATLGDSLRETMLDIDNVVTKRQSPCVFTGLAEFDEKFGGFGPGELVVLAARTSIGKTSLACQIAEYVASRGQRVYFCSLEMARKELAMKMVFGRAEIDTLRIRSGRLTSEEVSSLSRAASAMPLDAFLIHDRARFTVQDIARAARREARKGLSLVVVDYLQRITPTDRRVQRYEQIGEMTDGLKALARELNLPVLCLSQLNRESVKDDRPNLTHLRESGSIEQDADMVLFIYRSFSGAAKSKPGDSRAELIVEKNRMGDTGSVVLEWLPKQTRYTCRGSDGF